MNFAVVILAHKRTLHLNRVINSLIYCIRGETVRVIFACDRPSPEVISLIERSTIQNKEIITTLSFPESTAQAINRNLYHGLHRAFSYPEVDFVIVLEDDIVPMPDFLDYFKFINSKYTKSLYFRGSNAFSNYHSKDGLSDIYIKSNFGLGWGWSINRRIYNNWLKFWNGEENNHWDFIVEPYCRTGFVVNPLYSRIKNIGVDETATHHKGTEAQRQVIEIQKSADLTQGKITIFREGKEIIPWRTDFFTLSGSFKLFKIIIILIGRMSFAAHFMNFHQYTIGSRALRIIQSIAIKLGR